MIRKILYSFFLSIISLHLLAGVLKGVVKDESGNPLPYAHVYVKNTTYGIATNQKGEFWLELKPGNYTIVFSFVGHQTIEKDISIKHDVVVLHVVLKETMQNMQVAEIISDKKDMAKMIMKNVRRKRKFYLNQVESYKCNTYSKTSIEKELIKVKPKDTMPPKDTTKGEKQLTIEDVLKKEKLNLIEAFSETWFQYPSKYKEIVKAEKDYAEKHHYDGRSASITVNYERKDIAPKLRRYSNLNIIFRNISECDFNFYKNLIDYKAICEKPLLSPIAATSALNYSYEFLGSFYEEGKNIYKIGVKPILKSEALFSGYLFIEDSTWAIRSVDLSINPQALFFCQDFKIIQNYQAIDSLIYVPVRREVIYSIKDGRYKIHGNTRMRHSNYVLNPPIPARFFNNEVRKFEVDAFDKDSTFWMETRPVSLKDNEIAFIKYTDSLAAYYVSDEYYHKTDSSFNRIDMWSWLTGVGHRNRKKGREWYIEGIPSQINPFGIGGYRHKLPGYFQQEFDNNYLLETRGFVDYGFKNKDVKAKLGVGLTYVPLKFVRTYIEVGDYYTMINDYASIEQTFSRSNYVRAKTFSIAQRMEVINGLFAELSFNYSDKDPLKDIQLSEWSKQLFGELNKPSDFERYLKSEFRLDVKYRINQKYIIKRNKKIILGTDYPEINFIYKKGVPGLFDSEVNYDYFEIGTANDMQLARLGTSRWSIQLGSFVNKKSLRLLEYKYFRGSDRFFFSDPVQSFQLLPQTFNTPNEFLRANYIHHFEGTIMNKIPLLNRLKLGLAGGGGTLLIPDNDYSHIELFGGIEKTFRIKKQLFRFGVYGVTAGSSVMKADYSIKFGIDFFNSFTNKWSY
jgi:hypothetical protein